MDVKNTKSDKSVVINFSPMDEKTKARMVDLLTDCCDDRTEVSGYQFCSADYGCGKTRSFISMDIDSTTKNKINFCENSVEEGEKI